MRLIDADAARVKLQAARDKAPDGSAEKAAMDTFLFFLDACPPAEAIPAGDHKKLLMRFRHLMKSPYIASFDEVYPETGKYKRNIAEAVEFDPVRRGAWIIKGIGRFHNINTGRFSVAYRYTCNCCGWATGEQAKEFHFCPRCGAEMDAGQKRA